MRATQTTLNWLRAFYDALDNLRFDELESFIAEDCEVQYPSSGVVPGRARMIAIARKSLGSLDCTRHVIKNAWEEDGELIFEVEVTYRRRDGQVLVRPGIGIFVRDPGDGRVRAQRLFVDNKGVWD